MSVIAQAIADRQSEIDRLQAEIKALRRRRAASGNLRGADAAQVAALAVAAEGGCRGRGEQARNQAGEEAPRDVGRGEESGIGADDRLLGGAAQEGRQEVARTVQTPASAGPGPSGERRSRFNGRRNYWTQRRQVPPAAGRDAASRDLADPDSAAASNAISPAPASEAFKPLETGPTALDRPALERILTLDFLTRRGKRHPRRRARTRDLGSRRNGITAIHAHGKPQD